MHVLAWHMVSNNIMKITTNYNFNLRYSNQNVTIYVPIMQLEFFGRHSKLGHYENAHALLQHAPLKTRRPYFRIIAGVSITSRSPTKDSMGHFFAPNDCCISLGHFVWFCGDNKCCGRPSGRDMDWLIYSPDLTPCDFFSLKVSERPTTSTNKIPPQKLQNWNSVSLLRVLN